MRFYSALILSVLFLLNSCASAQTANRELTEQERYKLAAEYSQINSGVSVLVMKGDKIVFEDYENGHQADRPWFLASGTKSFSGVMACAAIEDKLIKNFDEKVSETITEWQSDERKSKITLRQLLSLTSGIDAGQIGRVPTYAEAVNYPVKYDAGTKFEYGPVPFQIFGEVMRRKLVAKNESITDYVKRRIFNPIGLNVGSWRMLDGNPLLPQGAFLTAREWVKFGLFLKNEGKWNGKQIVSQNLLKELTKGTSANPAYGITFWLNQAGLSPQGQAIAVRVEDEANSKFLKDVYMAAGAGNQRLYIIPSQDLVVVRQGNFGKYDDAEFLKRLILGKN